MEIVDFETAMAPEVARLYNEMIAPVPDTYPVPVQQFASLDALAGTGVQTRDETLRVAVENGEAIGFAHVAIASPAVEDWHPAGEPAVIRCLCYRPGQRAVGQALLTWAETWARGRGRHAISAWHYLYAYEYCQSPCTHLSDHIGHVRALLGMAGYRLDRDELYLTWRDYTPPPLRPPGVEVCVTTACAEGRLGLQLDIIAKQGDEWVGACRLERGRSSPAPDAAEWCYCGSLWVVDALQGRGLGRHLLSRGLTGMHERGCRHSAISTRGKNHRAALFYTNLGYRFTDYSTSWWKEIG